MPYRHEDMRTVRFIGPITGEQIRAAFGAEIEIVIKHVGQFGAPVHYATFPTMVRAIDAYLAIDGTITDNGEIRATMCASPDVRMPFTNVTSLYHSESNM